MGESERWHLTREQAELLTVAHTRGGVLLTMPGSANDILWGEFNDYGLMEPADAPEGLAALHAWRLTEAGHQTIADIATGNPNET